MSFLIPYSVLGLIDKALGMGYAKSHRKCLLLHGDSPLKQGPHGIPRAVSRSQDHCISLYFAPVSHNKSADCPFRDLNVLHLRFKTHFAACRDDPLPDRGNDRSELVRPDMRPALIENVPGCAGRDEYAQDLTAPACLVVDLCIQFSVRESSGAAFSELHIGSRIQDPGLPVSLDITAPFPDAAAALKKERSVPVLRQHKCAEESRRTGSDHNGP